MVSIAEDGTTTMGDSAQGPRGSLLYVEDDAEIAALTVEVLEEVYDVEHAADGETALRLALSRRYDAMVVDRRLPGMDGVDEVMIDKDVVAGTKEPVRVYNKKEAVGDAA